MLNILRRNPLVLLLIGSALIFFGLPSQSDYQNYDPTWQPNKKFFSKWRIGYVESGPYSSYQLSLLATIRGLMELGWIEPAELPKSENDKETETLWRWLVHDARSDYLEFAADAYWSPKWGKQKQKNIQQEIIQRLQHHDVDLMIVMGTWAGKEIGASTEHDVATVVMSTTDPISAGIIKSVEDSGIDHLHARVDPTRHHQQVRLFHDLIGFSHLGVVYENSEAGRSFGAIDSVEEIAALRGFQLHHCHAEHAQFIADSTENVQHCHEQLADEVDAVYVTRHPGVTPEAMDKLLAPLHEKNIPTFSQSASSTVKAGALIGIALGDLHDVGRFYAKTIAQILNGAKPRSLPQLFRSTPRLAFNISTAERIGYNPPADVLSIVSEFYQDEPEEEK